MEASGLVPTWAWAASLNDCAKLFADMAKAKNRARENADFFLMREFLAPGTDLRMEHVDK